MDSHHRRHHHPPPSSSSCCNCCCPCASGSSSCSPLPPADPLLLQAIAAAQLLQSQSHHHYLKPLHDQNQTPEAPQERALIQSLIRRIASLESSLPHLSPSPSPAPPAPRQQRRRRAARDAEEPPLPAPAPSPAPPGRRISLLRDSAARVIQARFRLHLVHRSQTLRHLQRLASIRSRVAAIKSSLYDYEQGSSFSSSRHLLGPKALSQQAMDLLLQLDSIQSQDPMIRDGKRSISNELVQIMDHADRIPVKRQELSLQGSENMSTKKKISKHQQQLQLAQAATPNPVKRVAFAGDGEGDGAPESAFADEQVEVFEGNSSTTRGSDEEEDEDEEDDLLRHLEAGEEGNEQQQEHHRSYGTRSSKGQQKAVSSPLSGLYAPLPVKMEPRRGRGNGRVVP